MAVKYCYSVSGRTHLDFFEGVESKKNEFHVGDVLNAHAQSSQEVRRLVFQVVDEHNNVATAQHVAHKRSL